ncbi:MAG: helix-turn-helix transcriptional regulator [Alphaproteobacteria bacterium]|nr:helix-turn-helix transcriptional regulator [Alphaproteobacteria bacterium]MBS4046554.1 helix-turn-helix transcriptional regulator [Alphaproteobacteria bacterium]
MAKGKARAKVERTSRKARDEEAKIGEVDKTWFESRARDMGINFSRIAEMLGMNRSIVSRMMSGEREVSNQEANELATILQVSFDDVVAHLGVKPKTDPNDFLPVVGAISADGIIHPKLPRGAFKSTRRIPGLPHDCSGLWVDAPGSWLDGSVLYYVTGFTVEPNAVGRAAVIGLKDGRKFVRILIHGTRSNRWRTQPLNGPLDPQDYEVAWATPVRAIVLPT